MSLASGMFSEDIIDLFGAHPIVVHPFSLSIHETCVIVYVKTTRREENWRDRRESIML